jgi:hypothetical protein
MSENPNPKRENYDRELRIRGVSKETKNLAVNVAKNKGVTYSQLLKPVISDFLNSQPDNVKQKPRDY